MSRLYLCFQGLSCVSCLLDTRSPLTVIQPNEYLIFCHHRSFAHKQFFDTARELARDGDMIALDAAICLDQSIRKSSVQDPPIKRYIAAPGEYDEQGDEDDLFSRDHHG